MICIKTWFFSHSSAFIHFSCFIVANVVTYKNLLRSDLEFKMVSLIRCHKLAKSRKVVHVVIYNHFGLVYFNKYVHIYIHTCVDGWWKAVGCEYMGIWHGLCVVGGKVALQLSGDAGLIMIMLIVESRIIMIPFDSLSTLKGARWVRRCRYFWRMHACT